MLSAIISTRESERSLVPTLNALFPAVMTGLLAEVIIADANSRVADIAGCQFLSSEAPLGQRLRDAVASSKSAWLLFLPAGSVLETSWVDAVQTFIGRGRIDRAGAFPSNVRGLSGLFGTLVGGRSPNTDC